MKKKNTGGVLARHKQHAAKIKNIMMFAIVAIAFITIGSIFNDAVSGLFGGLVSLALFVPATIPANETETQKIAREELDFSNRVKHDVSELIAKESQATKVLIDKLEAELKASQLKVGASDAEKAEMVRMASEIVALKESAKPEAVTMNSQLNGWLTENKAALIAIKGGSKADLTPLVIKVNSPMTPANTFNGSAYLPIPEFSPGATEIVRVEPTFWDYITKGRSSSAAYVWVNKKNPLGAAGFIGPGVIKPGVSFEIATEISNAKKIAVSEKTATELLEDIDGMASWIQQELTYQLRAKLNTTLMTGTASSTVPAGIQTISTTYSLTTVKTDDPNNWDACRACVAQLRSGNLQGPVTIFMNPIDYTNMILTKAQSQGQIFMPADTGATIVQDNNIAVGFIQVALLDYYKVLIYKDLTVSFGWENDDFTKNLGTTIAEMRIHQYFSENHTGAFIYDTLSNIKTAITAV